MKIAIIGAGLAGLVAARELARHHSVTVLEKARGVGGRMSSRYAGQYRFDHGAQFFTARSKAFNAYLEPMLAAGVVTPWHARFAEMTGPTLTQQRQWNDDYPHFVGVPNMNAVQKHLAQGLEVRTSTKVLHCDKRPNEWILRLEDGSEIGADWLIVTAPLEQTTALVGQYIDVGQLHGMRACFATMLGFDAEFEMQFDAARVLDADISWVSRNSSKPGRAAAMTVVVHATNAWADDNVDISIDAAHAHLTAELKRTVGIDASLADYAATHRWRFANVVKQDGPKCILNKNAKLGVCADWLIRGRVESAFLSAAALLAEFKRTPSLLAD